VLRARRLALTSPSGPVYLGIPTDLLGQCVSAPDGAGEPSATPTPAPPQQYLSAALALLEQCRQPLIWAGGGALRAGAGPAVGELATRLAAPVLTTYMGRGLLPAD